MQMRSAPSVRAHHQRQETDTAVHKKGILRKLTGTPYAIGQFTEIGGGLNGSTQHSAQTHIHMKTKAKSAG
jgi:hypothetical protein